MAIRTLERLATLHKVPLTSTGRDYSRMQAMQQEAGIFDLCVVMGPCEFVACDLEPDNYPSKIAKWQIAQARVLDACAMGLSRHYATVPV